MTFNFAPYLNVLPNVLFAFVIGLVITPFLRMFGLRFGFATKPKEQSDPTERGYATKHHKKTTSRLGEFAMVIPLLLLMWNSLNLNVETFGFVFALILIAMIGAFDAKYNLSEFLKLFILVIAAFLLIFSGIVIDVHSILGFNFPDVFLNNPLTGTHLSMFSVLVTLAWLVLIPTALSYVGGVDGLGEGTSAIAILMLLLIGIRNSDPFTITVASLALGGILGMLPYNFHPAVIFSEHLTFGFVIAILSIVSPAKVTTAILILTIPLADFIYVASYRVRKYFKENSKKKFNLRLLLHYLGTGDRNHLQHKLMSLGLNAVQISLLEYAAYAVFGFVALAVSGLYLTFAILGTALVVVLIYSYLHRKLKETKNAR